jgi:hypothetical protein
MTALPPVQTVVLLSAFAPSGGSPERGKGGLNWAFVLRSIKSYSLPFKGDVTGSTSGKQMIYKFLIGVVSALALGGAGLVVAPVASAGPYCDVFDVFGLCDVRDALKACDADPEACKQYSPPPSTRYQSP